MKSRSVGPGVAGDAVGQGADRLHDERFLFVVDARQVGDLHCRPAADADVDVLAGALGVSAPALRRARMISWTVSRSS